MKILEKLHVYLSYKHNYIHVHTCIVEIHVSYITLSLVFASFQYFFNSREEIDPSGSASIMYALSNKLTCIYVLHVCTYFWVALKKPDRLNKVSKEKRLLHMKSFV